MIDYVSRPGTDLFTDARGASDRTDSNQIPDDFKTYLQVVLWKQGVDVSRMQGKPQYDQLVKALWEDQFIQDLYSDVYGQTLQSDPMTGAPLTDANFEAAIGYELFDPTRTHNQFILSQGLNLLKVSGRQLSEKQQNYDTTGGDPVVLGALARAAQETGVPYNVAFAVAMAESGLNPKAKGDGGHSIGLFMLHDEGEGAGMSVQEREDPYTNAVRALREFAAVAAQDPSVTNDPGRWAARAQQPADPDGYATRVNNLLQSGFGGSPSGIVPTPFDKQFAGISGYGYGDPDSDFASGTHEGIDYGVPEGTPLYSPFAGTVIAGAQGGYGNIVTVRLDNGFEFRMAHMSSFAVATGQRVNPGDLLGESGSTGNATGPHVHVEWRTPGGNAMDPRVVLDPIFSGTATFRSLNLTGAEGQGVSAISARQRMLGIDPILESKYPTAVSKFEQYFGRHPTASELHDLIAHGTTADELDAYLRNKPSHIPGLSIGMYQDIKGNLDLVSNKLFGHGGTDGMVKELADQGKTSPTAITFWMEQQDIAGKMDPKTYASLWKANLPHMQAVYNEKGFDPRIAVAQHQRMQTAGPQAQRRVDTSGTIADEVGRLREADVDALHRQQEQSFGGGGGALEP